MRASMVEFNGTNGFDQFNMTDGGEVACEIVAGGCCRIPGEERKEIQMENRGEGKGLGLHYQ